MISEEKIKNEIDALLDNNNSLKIPKNVLLSKDKKILIIGGGSLKGISAIGALKALKDLDCLANITEYVGTSIGSFIVMLLNIGFTPEEIYDFILLLDFKKTKNLNINTLFTKFGMDSGEKITNILEKLLNEKNYNKNITLLELYNWTKKKLVISSACINTKTIEYFSYKTHPNLSVIKAVRMSIAIPLYFTPVEYNGLYYIDGGCIDNYPISLYKNKLNDVIGIHLSSKKTINTKITKFDDYLSDLINTLFEGVRVNSIKGYENYTIDIVVNDINIINMDFDNEKKKELFIIGYNCVMENIL